MGFFLAVGFDMPHDVRAVRLSLVPHDSKFTSTGIPWIIVYKENFESLAIAKKREQEIKKMKSRKYIEKLVAQL